MVTSPSLYVALGDSTGVGVGARDGRGYVAHLYERLRQERSGVQLLNLCISGATSRDVVHRQLPRADVADSAVATVLIGINDLIQGVPPATFAKNVERVAEVLAQRDTRALFCTLPDLAHAPAAAYLVNRLNIQRSFFEGLTRTFNTHLVDRARSHGHAVLDLFGVPLRDPTRFFSADGFHPSEHGYEELADQLWPEFSRLADAHA